MPDKNSHARSRSGSLLSVIVVAMIAIFAGLLIYSLPGFRIGTIDEPWIGEQAYHLATDGTVRSTMFTSYADNEIQIYVYHKLLVWIAALLIKLFGLKLWLLRLISVVSCLFLFRLIFLYLRSQKGERFQYLLTLLILLACPLFFMRIDIFRPEFLTAFLGFASFYLLSRSIGRGGKTDFMLAGICAGMAVLAHLNGAIFLIAGGVLLLSRRQYLSTTIFTVTAIVVALFYFVDSFGHFETLIDQFLVSPAHPARSLNPVAALTNLLEEHKRLFRRPDIIGLSTLYVLSLIYRWLRLKRLWTNDTIYAIAMIISLGLINSNKTPTYAILVFPFMAVSIATVVVELVKRERTSIFKSVAAVIVPLYVGYGLYANGNTALSKREFVADRHRQVANLLPAGARVVAPLKFMFNEIGRFDIRAFEGIHLILESRGMRFTMEKIGQFADSIRADYVLVDYEFESDLNEKQLNSDINTLRPYELIDSTAGYLILKQPRENSQP